MPYLNTQSGLSWPGAGQAAAQAQAAAPQAVQQQSQPNVATLAGGILGHLLGSAFSPQQVGQPMQLTGANPQTAPQGGLLSRLIANLGSQQQQQQQQPSGPGQGQAQGQQQATGGLLGNTRFVNGLNVVG